VGACARQGTQFQKSDGIGDLDFSTFSGASSSSDGLRVFPDVGSTFRWKGGEREPDLRRVGKEERKKRNPRLVE